MSETSSPLNGAAIIVYHRVADDPVDPFDQAVGTANFAEHVAVLRERETTTVAALADAVAARQVPAGRVAVSFDDGFVDNLRAAAPVLEAADVPATVFVTTEPCLTGRPFWWNELAELLVGPQPARGPLELTTGAGTRRWELADDAAHADLIDIWAWLRARPLEDIEEALTRVRLAAGVTAGGSPAGEAARNMTPDEVAGIAATGHITIGGHTRTHPVLAARTPAEQLDDVRVGRRLLEEWTGAPVLGFAYPFGKRVADFRAASMRAVKAAGFAFACAIEPRAVTASAPILALPRYVVPDVGGAEFERWLDACLSSPGGPSGPRALGEELRHRWAERRTPPGRYDLL
jgi:peptidoglycan/xylan/chitin deacetylase (PgdA/CDA1 family)